MTPLVDLPALIADIGGTNARIAWIDRDGRTSEPVVFPIADYPSFDVALVDRVLPLTPEPPRSMVLALAANIEGEEAKLTRGHWTFAPRSLIAAYDLREIVLLNDFEALALSLPVLPSDGLLSFGPTDAVERGPKLVVGPGTGLGIAALMPVGNAWLPVRSEGGHVDLGPSSGRDFELWPHLSVDGARIDAESVLSGAGIERWYAAIMGRGGKQAPSKGVGEIVAAAASGADAAAAEAIRVFTEHLGRYTGDLALLFLARGGVYIGGGVVGRLKRLFDGDMFRASFMDKAPFSSMLSSIPISLITHPTPAFLGISALIADPARFLLDLSSRHWRAD